MTAPGAAALIAAPRRWADPTALRAVTVELPPGPEIDPFALSCGPAGGGPGVMVCSSRLVLAGRGTAARLALGRGLAGSDHRAVRAWLAAVPGSGATAFGSLAFAPDEAGALVVPSLLYGRSADREWVTTVTPGPAPGAPGPDPVALRAELAAARVRHAPAPRCTGVTGAPDHVFTDAAARVLDAIGHGRLSKVVLARRVDAAYDAPLDPAGVLRRLRALEPSATVYCIVDPSGTFLGASPELLVARRALQVESAPMAGTVGLDGDARHDDDAVGRLLASPKEADEHNQVVDAVVAALGPFCAGAPRRSGPAVARLRTVAHLASRVTGTLRDDGDGGADALALVAALHPTPAVAGTPTRDALALLQALEPEGRGPYAGPVGWMDADGDGDFVVAIRGATLRGSHAAVYAGAGIVAGSDPERELVETSLKLRTALSALSAAATGDVTRRDDAG